MIVLIPGLASNSEIFFMIKTACDEWSLPYHELNYNISESNKNDKSSPQKNFLHQMESLISKHNTKDLTIIAWSMGGLLLLDFMNKFDIDLKKIILISVGNITDFNNSPISKLENSLLSNNNINKDIDQFLSTAIEIKPNKENLYLSNIKRINIEIKDFITNNKPYILNSINYIKDFNLYKTPHADFVMIHGLEDKIIPISDAQILKKELRKAGNIVNFYSLSCGHIPFIEANESFLEIIEHELF